MRGGRVLRDAQNVYQAGFDVPTADAEGAAPGDAAAQQQQKAEQRVRRANEQTEQAIRLLVFITDGGEREEAPAQRGGQAKRQTDGHQHERHADMRDEGRGERGAGLADEGFIRGDIAGIRAGIQLTLDRAAPRNAGKAEERERHQHGLDRRVKQGEQERNEHQRQQECRKGELARGARVELLKEGIELLQRAGEAAGEFRRGAVEDEREEKCGGIDEQTHGREPAFLNQNRGRGEIAAGGTERGV